MHAHGDVGGDGSVQERPFGLTTVVLAKPLEGPAALPELQDGPFLGRQIDLRIHLLERHGTILSRRTKSRHSSKDTQVPARVPAGHSGRVNHSTTQCSA